MIYFLIAVLVIVILVFGFGFLVHHIAFGKRCMGDKRLKYFTHEDFEGLKAAPVEFKSNKGQILKGNLYLKSGIRRPCALVIFSHGFGGGHLSYMTEINTFARNGFAVLAYDNTGTFASQGDSLVGFFQGVRDLNAAVNYARSNEKLKNLPIILAGHSWGGYSVCQALAECKGISGAVAFSAPETGYQVICEQISAKAGFLLPLFKIIFFLKEGKASLRKCSDALSKTNVPTLLLHGDCDPVVKPAESPVTSPAVQANSSITTIMYENRRHNVYQTAESEEYLGEVMAGIQALKKIKKPSREEIEFCYDIDYELITREDPIVMQTVINFMKNCI